MAELPMFPLGSVLLPTTILPLRLFEPRYLKLLEDVLAGDREFGVALIERGHEVGGGDERSNVGCVAQVLDAEEHEGLWHLVAVGTRRFTVERWLADDPYPRAEVTMLDEPAEADGDAELYAAARAQLVTVLALQGEMGQPTPAIPDLAEDAALGSFQVAALAPFGPFDRQQLLAAAAPTERLRRVQSMLTDLEADLRAQLRLG